MLIPTLEYLTLKLPEELFKKAKTIFVTKHSNTFTEKDKTTFSKNNSGNGTIPSLNLNIEKIKNAGNAEIRKPQELFISKSNTSSTSDTNKIKFSNIVKLQEGVNMYIPQNPVKPDGTVDIIIQFRGVVPERFSEAGVNAIVITAETNGLSGPMMEKFGYNNFVPQILDRAMTVVKKQYGQDIKTGRLAMGSFSAGYAPLGAALSNPAVRAKTDAVIVIDGIHYGKSDKPSPAGHKPFVDFAKEAVNDNKLMVITHSSIKPNYSSSTNAADYIINQVGAKRVLNTGTIINGYKNRYGETNSPATKADLNGFHVEGYNGNAAKNHVEQIDNLGNVWNRYLAPRWK